jgi:hypothetical protein
LAVHSAETVLVLPEEKKCKCKGGLPFKILCLFPKFMIYTSFNDLTLIGTNVSIWKVELLECSGPYGWLVYYVAIRSSTAQRASLAFLTILTVQEVGNLNLPLL